MNTDTEQVFLVNAADGQPTSMQRDFPMPVEALAPEGVRETNLCHMVQDNLSHLPSTSMPLQTRTQMCRLCATITEFVVPIFEGEGLQNRLADKIHQHLPIEVSETDILPTVMCFQCTSTLLAWHELVTCSVQADTAMRERYNLHQTEHKVQQHPTISNNQGQTKEEKLDESPRAIVPCEFCSRDVPDSDLRSHLLDFHPERLYLCAECHLYRNKVTMMEHMGKHIEADELDQKDLNEPEIQNKPTLKIVIPVVRIQRVPPKTPAPLPKPATPPPPPTPVTPPVKYPSPQGAESLNAPEDVSLQGSKPVLLLLRAAESVEISQSKHNTAPPSYSESIRVTEQQRSDHGIRNEGKNNSPSTIEPTIMKVLSNAESHGVVERNVSPKRDEFSDHSDIENEFGILPASVFDAIEDTEDGNSNEEEETSVPSTKILESKESKKVKKPPGPCQVCGKTYTSLSSWYYHMKHAHATDKEIPCDSCDKVFASKERLEVHKRTHTKDKPYPCKVCGKGFSSAAGRYIHEQTHTDKRQFPCTQCGRAFRWRTLLKRHEARHANKQDFVCKVCGRGFSVGFDLIRHARRHEPGCHECDLCGSKFKQKRYLKVHMENKHFAQYAGVAPNVDTQN